jgi:ABC-type multidrug transport system fused ATPase/permease subunit
VTLSTHPAGFVDLTDVWLDDRRRCTWALRGLALSIGAGRAVAIVGGEEDGGPAAVLDLLARRRFPIEGKVSFDGVDVRDLDPTGHQQATRESGLVDVGERTLLMARHTRVAIRPTLATLAAADLVVVLVGGAAVARGTHESLLASSRGYEQLLAS